MFREKRTFPDSIRRHVRRHRIQYSSHNGRTFDRTDTNQLWIMYGKVWYVLPWHTREYSANGWDMTSTIHSQRHWVSHYFHILIGIVCQPPMFLNEVRPRTKCEEKTSNRNTSTYFCVQLDLLASSQLLYTIQSWSTGNIKRTIAHIQNSTCCCYSYRATHMIHIYIFSINAY